MPFSYFSFILSFRQCTPVSDQCSGDVKNIECESENYQYKTCPINESRIIVSAKVIDKRSQSACKGPLLQNSTETGMFGFSDNTLWVDGGCYAKFEICHVGKLNLLT